MSMGGNGLESLYPGRMVEDGLVGGELSVTGTMWIKMTAAYVNSHREEKCII